MSSIRIGDYLDHDDPAVRAAADDARTALAGLLRAIREADVVEQLDGDDDDFEAPAPEPKRRQAPAGSVQAKDVRSWARANGIDVNPKGSVRTAVWALYQAAHPADGGEDL